MDVTAYLNQGDIWYTIKGTETKVADMSKDHATLAARWLYDNSTGLISIVEAAKNEGAITGDGSVKDVLALLAQSPRHWITQTSLYRSLIKVSGGAVSPKKGQSVK